MAEKEADFAYVRENFRAEDIIACTDSFVHVNIARTQNARIAVRVHFSEGYPACAVVAEITQTALPSNFARRLAQQCNEKAKQHLGEPQVEHVLGFLKDLVERNLFVPCWKEVKQVTQLCEGKGDLSCDDKTGKLRMKVRNGNYRLTVDVTVSPQYPDGGVSFTFGTSAFPAHIMFIFQAQAEEIVRKCLNGYPPELALQASNPIRMPAKMAKADSGKVRLTSDSVKNLKHDVAVLKQFSDLRDVNASKRGGSYANTTDERREARRELRKLAKSEHAADRAQEENEKEMERKEFAASTAGSAPPVSDNAQPCLLVLFKFLVDHFAYGVPNEKCIACNENVFPPDPNAPSITDESHPRRPMRVFCGHWFHWECLNEWLTTPPFLRHCPIDERRIYHPEWTASIKTLERAWANKEARIREIGEVSDFLAVDDRFQTGGDDFSAFA